MRQAAAGVGGSLPVQRAEIDRINSGSELVPTKRETSGALAGAGVATPVILQKKITKLSSLHAK